MPRNPSTGVFTRVSNSFSDPVVGTVIDQDDAISLYQDYDAALTNTIAIGAVQTILAGDQTQILTNLGGTATGRSLFKSADAVAARTTLGATSLGSDLFTAVSAAAGRTTLGVAWEAGTNGTGSWLKIPGGWMICTQRVLKSSVSWGTTAWGGFADLGSASFPATFSSAPTVIAQVIDGVVDDRSAWSPLVTRNTSGVLSLYIATAGTVRPTTSINIDLISIGPS